MSFKICAMSKVSQASTVTDYDDKGIRVQFPAGQEIFLFFTMSTPASYKVNTMLAIYLAD
jgi:hypothetical protein